MQLDKKLIHEFLLIKIFQKTNAFILNEVTGIFEAHKELSETKGLKGFRYKGRRFLETRNIEELHPSLSARMNVILDILDYEDTVKDKIAIYLTKILMHSKSYGDLNALLPVEAFRLLDTKPTDLTLSEDKIQEIKSKFSKYEQMLKYKISENVIL